MSFTRALPPLLALSIIAGAVAHLAGAPVAGDAVWAVALVAVLVPLTVGVGAPCALGDVGVDVIALLAMAARAGAGAVLAGAVVALMLTGGNALEAAAGRRARRELTALLERRRASRTGASDCRRRGGRRSRRCVPGDVVARARR